MKSRIIGLLLLVAMLCAVILPACGNQPAENPGTTETAPETAPEAEMILIAQPGVKSDWRVVRSDFSKDNVSRAAASVRSALIGAYKGCEVTIKTDWEDPVEHEILIGKTNRPESSEILEQLDENEFIICMKGTKLVVIGDQDAGTIAATQYFLKEIMKYDPDSKVCGTDKLDLPADYYVKGEYVPEPEIPDGPNGEKYIYLVQPAGEQPENPPRKESTTPTAGLAYVTPKVAYDSQKGVYISEYEKILVNGDTSTFQTVDTYNDSLYFRSDAVMCYVTNKGSADSVFSSWMKRSNEYSINMMMALNRDNGVYVQRDPSKISDVQTREDGSLFIHSGETNYYMVPTKDWIEFVWDTVKYCMEEYNPDVITFEEPEMWYASGYSQGFKDDWEDYYGEPWENQTSSPEAMYKTMALKTYLVERILKTMSDRIRALNPNTKVYIATHSTLNYADWAITAGLDSYLKLEGVIDGVIGQTWSDTANTPLPQGGTNEVDPFLNAFLDYASFLDAVKGTTFYALSDPMADGKYTEEQCQFMYRQTLIASLLQPEIQRFQMFPWPSRSFLGVSPEYRTLQLNVFNALDELVGAEITMSTGTPGISYLLSDSISWQRNIKNWSLKSSTGLYGVTVPLAKSGIRTTFKSMERIRSAADLEGVSVLIVAYDCQKPKDEHVNEILADWVRQGGTLLYIGGRDEYDKMQDSWWQDIGFPSPLEHLLDELGLSIHTGEIKSGGTINYVGTGTYSGLSGHTLPVTYARYAVTFSGQGANPILKIGDNTIGIDQAVGKGHFVAIGLPGAAFTATARGNDFDKDAVKYALQYTDRTFTATDFVWAKRGNVFAGHAISKSATVTGSYINLLDPDLPVVKSVVCPAKDSVLLYDISGLELSVPRIGFTGGMVQSKTETAAETRLRITGPTGTIMSTRILCPSGIYPQTVSAIDSAGDETVAYANWDGASRSLLIQVEGEHDGVELVVTWGTAQTDLKADYTPRTLTVKVNNQDLDKPFIYASTAASNDSLKFCDADRYIIYKFDLKTYTDAKFSFQLYQNYIIEFSYDLKTWYVFADYSLDHEFTMHGGNMDWFHLPAKMYEPYRESGKDTLYVRLRSTDTSKGWGGSILSFSINWFEQE